MNSIWVKHVKRKEKRIQREDQLVTDKNPKTNPSNDQNVLAVNAYTSKTVGGNKCTKSHKIGHFAVLSLCERNNAKSCRK